MNNGNANNKRTVVEEGTTFKGMLSASCPIDVRGRIEGEVETPALVVSQSGAVHGRAKVGSVHSNGELSGEFEADTIELAGTVKDNTKIRARSLEVKLASTRGQMQATFGDCELSIGDEPTEHDLVEEPAPPEMIEAAAEPAAVDVPALLEPPHAVEAEAAPAEPSPEAPADKLLMSPMAEALAAVTEERASQSSEEVGAPEAERADAAMAADESHLAAVAPDKDDQDRDEVPADLSANPGESIKGGRRRRKEATPPELKPEGEHTGWSHPPSQPPPAS